MFLMEHFQEGGWGMWPIVVLFIMTVYIWIDRQMYVSKSKVDVDKLMSLLKSQIVVIDDRHEHGTGAIHDRRNVKAYGC